jgi:hypothetical protein
MLRGAHLLDSLYSGMSENDPLEKKKEIKQAAIQKIIDNLDTLSLALTKNPSQRFKDKLPNNAYFMNFLQYQSKQNIFGEEWSTVFHGDLRAYILHLSEKYPFL